MRVSYSGCHCVFYCVNNANIVKSSFILRRFTIGASSDIEIVSHIIYILDEVVVVYIHLGVGEGDN